MNTQQRCEGDERSALREEPEHRTEAQDYQSIGQLAPQVDAIADQHQGWVPTLSQPSIGETKTEDPIEEQTDASDYSFRDSRANAQLLGLRIPNMAGFVQTPVAAITVTPTADTSQAGDRP